MAKYLKLGEKATSFYDPTTKFLLTNNQVKEVLPFQLKSPRLKRFLQGGGLVFATKEEFKEFQASSEKPKPVEKVEEKVEEKTEPTKKPLEEMTKAELYDHIKASGWEKEDVDAGLAIDKKADLLEYVKTTESAYE